MRRCASALLLLASLVFVFSDSRSRVPGFDRRFDNADEWIERLLHGSFGGLIWTELAAQWTSLYVDS